MRFFRQFLYSLIEDARRIGKKSWEGTYGNIMTWVACLQQIEKSGHNWVVMRAYSYSRCSYACKEWSISCVIKLYCRAHAHSIGFFWSSSITHWKPAYIVSIPLAWRPSILSRHIYQIPHRGSIDHNLAERAHAFVQQWQGVIQR